MRRSGLWSEAQDLEIWLYVFWSEVQYKRDWDWVQFLFGLAQRYCHTPSITIGKSIKTNKMKTKGFHPQCYRGNTNSQMPKISWFVVNSVNRFSLSSSFCTMPFKSPGHVANSFFLVSVWFPLLYFGWCDTWPMELIRRVSCVVNTFYQYAREHLSNSRERAFAAVALASRELYKGYSETKKAREIYKGFSEKKRKYSERRQKTQERSWIWKIKIWLCEQLSTNYYLY